MGNNRISMDFSFEQRKPADRVSSKSVWQAMIDEALR